MIIQKADGKRIEIWTPNIEEVLKGGSKMDCNKKIADYLKDHGITQKYLVIKTGIEPEKVSNIINGKRKITGDELIAICNVLGLTLDYFKDQDYVFVIATTGK